MHTHTFRKSEKEVALVGKHANLLLLKLGRFLAITEIILHTAILILELKVLEHPVTR